MDHTSTAGTAAVARDRATDEQDEARDDELLDDELLVEEISIDGMCGVY
jgi:mycofactocin precursor